MRRLILVAVLLGMLATVSKCLGNELVSNQISYIVNEDFTDYNLEVKLPRYESVNDRLNRLESATDKWGKYEYVCLELYARILIDLDYMQAHKENEGDLDAANHYGIAYDDVVGLFENRTYVYDAMLDILEYLDYYCSSYSLDVLTETDEYSTYMKWDYSIWFGCLRKLECNQDEQAYNIDLIQNTMEQYHIAIENADNPDDMGEIVEVYLNKKFVSMSVGECLDKIEILQNELDMWEEM